MAGAEVLGQPISENGSIMAGVELHLVGEGTDEASRGKLSPMDAIAAARREAPLTDSDLNRDRLEIIDARYSETGHSD